MAKWIRSDWNPEVGGEHPLFHPLSLATREFADRSQWPGIDDYNALIQQLNPSLRSQLGTPIQFVPQSIAPGQDPPHWEKEYEPRIYLDGEVQTRTENWHDFFQVLVWYCFPKTKSTLNALHYERIKHRKEIDPNSKQRDSLENALTQFDECGAVITSSDASLLQLIETFQWKTLFWNRRLDIHKHLRCFVFGHAIYEKALNPYPGLTAHSILLKTGKDFDTHALPQQLNHIDSVLSQQFSDQCYQSPRDFHPFPILGLPGWVVDNDQESYYDNTQYFRPGRTGKRGHSRHESGK